MTHEPLGDTRLREGLRELARADAALAAPPDVERALLRAWDAHHATTNPANGGSSRARARPDRLIREKLTRVAVSALAAGLLWAAVVGIHSRARPERADAFSTVDAPTLARDAVVPDPGVHDAGVAGVGVAVVHGAHRPRPPASAPRTLVAGTRASASVGPVLGGTTFVLVDEPAGAGERVHVVRMRILREALGSMGVATSGSGDTVDVDVVVGEDGVARTLTVGM